MNKPFQPGDPLWWHDQPRAGWGAFHPITAVFVKYYQKRVGIAVLVRSGEWIAKRVTLQSIERRSV